MGRSIRGAGSRTASVGIEERVACLVVCIAAEPSYQARTYTGPGGRIAHCSLSNNRPAFFASAMNSRRGVFKAVRYLAPVTLAGYHDAADKILGALFQFLHPISEQGVNHQIESHEKSKVALRDCTPPDQ